MAGLEPPGHHRRPRLCPGVGNGILLFRTKVSFFLPFKSGRNPPFEGEASRAFGAGVVRALQPSHLGLFSRKERRRVGELQASGGFWLGQRRSSEFISHDSRGGRAPLFVPPRSGAAIGAY